MQLMIFFICHPRWDIRRIAYNVVKRIITSVPQLSEDLFSEFSKYLYLIEEKLSALRIR
jgi:hypothetical protein